MADPPPILRIPCPLPTTPDTGVGKGCGDFVSVAEDIGAGDNSVIMFEISGSFAPCVDVALWGRPPPPLDPGGVRIFGDFETFDNPNPNWPDCSCVDEFVGV